MQRLASLVKTGISLIKVAPLSGISANIPSILQSNNVNRLLPSFTPMFNPSMGLKIKGRIRRRCKSCYLVYRDNRAYIMCHKFGRHKQTEMKQKPHNTWILTHASQSRVRPW